jgi:hypothetical protein
VLVGITHARVCAPVRWGAGWRHSWHSWQRTPSCSHEPPAPLTCEEGLDDVLHVQPAHLGWAQQQATVSSTHTISTAAPPWGDTGASVPTSRPCLTSEGEVSAASMLMLSMSSRPGLTTSGALSTLWRASSCVCGTRHAPSVRVRRQHAHTLRRCVTALRTSHTLKGGARGVRPPAQAGSAIPRSQRPPQAPGTVVRSTG